MIKVVHLITGLDTGGAEMMLYKLLDNVNRGEIESIVISITDQGTIGRRIEALGIPVYTLNVRPGPLSLLGLLRLTRILKKERPDVLQTWLYHADLMGLISVRLARVPFMIWNFRCSGLKKKDHSWFLFLIIRILAIFSGSPSAIIVNSRAGKRDHEALGFRPDRWEVIPNGFDLDVYRPSEESRLSLRRELGLPDHAQLIGLVARFNPMKGHENFINAAGYLHKLRPDLHFVLVGHGIDNNNKGLMKQISELRLNEHLHLLGERSDVPNIIPAFDILASSSYGEGFPNVIGEAMSCGVPCVVTDAGDSAYLVGETGIVVPPDNPIAMAGALNVMLSKSKEEYDSLSRAARERIASLFSIDTITRQYEKLYSDIAANRGGN